MNSHEISLRAVFSLSNMSPNEMAREIVLRSIDSETTPSGLLAEDQINRPVKEIFVRQENGDFYIFCAKTLLAGNFKKIDSKDCWGRVELASKLGLNALSYGEDYNLGDKENNKIDLFGPFNASEAIGFIETILFLNTAYEAKHEAEIIFKMTAPKSMQPK